MMRRDRCNPRIMHPPEVSPGGYDPTKGKLLNEQERFYLALYHKQMEDRRTGSLK